MRRFAFLPVATVLACASCFALSSTAQSQEAEQNSAQAAALTVSVAKPEAVVWPVTIPASGRLAAWHEAVIAAEVSGQRIIDVRTDVGAFVKKGDLLVQFAPETAQAELEQQQAAVEQAEADLEQATANADRARGLTGSGALSNQQTTEYLITERKAKAELASARAALTSAQLTFDRTKIYAIDDGVISERSASLGKVVTAGVVQVDPTEQGRMAGRVTTQATAECRGRHKGDHPNTGRRGKGGGQVDRADDIDGQWSGDGLCHLASGCRHAIAKDWHSGQWLF